MRAEDIRWRQRFSNDEEALAQLDTSFSPPALNEREMQGLIKVFEYTFEQAWNILRETFRPGLIDEGEAWMPLIQYSNLTSHTYNSSTADAIAENIRGSYLACIHQLSTRVEQRLREEAP